ncbi:MarR family winged helix-turn-helix transcriptional regulator [Pannonibacter tanglangensis]|uniref:MarR family transcriptional regulator n=1 Tax=Pannonibacter tanglangensis TaxID=2750084 RepID=A0ABW9ZCP3_9HYPH|nr:MarR family transcriptional regulator [Pannonibacter sp. XCT-34]NBN62599.1 MarR family transcriptional regulator [Pannonibacter sp. XCT-34]
MTASKGSSDPTQPAPAACEDLLKLGNFLCFSVYSAGHAFTRAYKPILDKLGLTYPQYLVMVALWERDGQTVGGLGGRLGLESNTLTPLVKRLETMDLVARQRCTEDERQVRVRLSDKGRSLKSRAAGIPLCLGAATGLTVEDARRMQADLERLREALEAAAPALPAVFEAARGKV